MTHETHSPTRLDSLPRLTARQSVTPPALRRLTISQRTTYRWSLIEEIVACEQAGLGGLGLWRPKLAEFGEARAVELIRESGLAVSSLSWGGVFTGLHGYSYEDAVADAHDALVLAGELGAATLILLSGPRLDHIRPHRHRLVVDGLKALADTAAALGVTLVLEPMRWPEFSGWTFLHAIDDALRVLESCGHDAVKLAFDTFHLGHEPGVADRLRDIAPRVGLVQLADCREQPWGERECCLPGDGRLPLDEIIGGLVAGGYEGFFEIEAWSEAIWDCDYDELLAESAEWFRDLAPPQDVSRRAGTPGGKLA